MWRLMVALMVSVVVGLAGCTRGEDADPGPASTTTSPTTTLPADIERIGEGVTEVVALFKAHAINLQTGTADDAALSGERADEACDGLVEQLSGLEGFDTDPHLAAIAIGCIQPYLDTLTAEQENVGDNIQTSWDRYLASRGLD